MKKDAHHLRRTSLENLISKLLQKTSFYQNRLFLEIENQFTKNSFTKILTNNNSTRKWFISVLQN